MKDMDTTLNETLFNMDFQELVNGFEPKVESYASTIRRVKKKLGRDIPYDTLQRIVRGIRKNVPLDGNQHYNKFKYESVPNDSRPSVNALSLTNSTLNEEQVDFILNTIYSLLTGGGLECTINLERKTLSVKGKLHNKNVQLFEARKLAEQLAVDRGIISLEELIHEYHTTLTIKHNNYVFVKKQRSHAVKTKNEVIEQTASDIKIYEDMLKRAGVNID